MSFRFGISGSIIKTYILLNISYLRVKISVPARGTKGAPLRGACIIFGAGGRFVPKIDRKREQIPQKDRFVPKKQRYSEQTLLFYLKETEKFEFMRQPRLFLAIVLAIDIDDHRLLHEQFDQVVITMFQLELQLFRV